MQKQFYVKDSFLNEITITAHKTPNREVCGLMVGKIKDELRYEAKTIFEVENIKSEESNIDYLMSPNDQMKILSETTIINKQSPTDLVCIWHTHPLPYGVPIPSQIDVNQVSFNVVYLIYGLGTETFKAYTFNKPKGIFEEIKIEVTK